MAKCRMNQSLADMMEIVMKDLVAACKAGEPCDDPILTRFSGSPEGAAAALAREVMMAEAESGDEISTKRFIG